MAEKEGLLPFKLIEEVSCPTNSEQLLPADKSEFLTVLC
jgi:hypothetical protein